MPVELNARCGDASNGHGAFHAGKRKRKRCQMEKQHKEEGDGITATIPADILGDVLKRMNPKEAVQLGSVCRYWRAPALVCDPTRRSTPWKIALTQSDFQLHFRLQSIADGSFIVNIRPVHVCIGTLACLGSWNGWLGLRCRTPETQLFLLNPFSRVRLSLPPCDDLRDVLCLTSDPGAPGCAIIARDYGSSLLIWRPGDRSWAAQAVEGGLGFCSAVWLKEQLFVLDLHPPGMRLLSVQLNPPRCKVVQVTFCRDMLNPSGRRPYLVESQGDLLAFEVGVCAFQVGECDYGEESWLGFRTYRLDWDTMAFVQVKSLGADRAMFLGGGGQSLSVSAGEAGCGAGCMYFADSYDCSESWSKFSWHPCSLKDGAEMRVGNQDMPRISNDIRQFWITPCM